MTNSKTYLVSKNKEGRKQKWDDGNITNRYSLTRDLISGIPILEPIGDKCRYPRRAAKVSAKKALFCATDNCIYWPLVFTEV